MGHELENITPILNTTPDIATEQEDRTFHRDNVERYFRAHPGEIVTQDELERAGGGDAVRTRVSECKLKLRMRIVAHPTFMTDSAGKKHRIRTRYQFLPEAPLIEQKSLF